MHTHHILPRKAPYLPDLHCYRLDATWLVSLTEEGHADQHDVLYRAFGWWGDKIASRALSGIATCTETISEARKKWTEEHPEHHANAGRIGGKAPATTNSKRVSAETARKTGKLPWWNNGTTNKRSAEKPGPDFVFGRLPLWGGSRKLSTSACPHCGLEMTTTNLSRHIQARHVKPS